MSRDRLRDGSPHEPGRDYRGLEEVLTDLVLVRDSMLAAGDTLTGDGVGIIWRKGLPLEDIEFFQFHPTVLADGDAFLVSEAVRGEGAVLRDEQGRRFMLDVHPDAELAPRDVVARAIAEVMAGQGGRPVLLDATGLRPTRKQTASFLAQRFPTIDAAVRARGLDWAREPVPVTPAAHYLMGGVDTDLHGRTDVPGLYAVGEVARTGVHGANRTYGHVAWVTAVRGKTIDIVEMNYKGKYVYNTRTVTDMSGMQYILAPKAR